MALDRLRVFVFRAISRAGQQATTGLEEDDVQSYRMLFATSVEDEPTLMAYRRE